MPTIQELIAMTKAAEEKNTALDELAQQQVLNQGFREPGQSASAGFTGRGTPEQQRAMVAMLSRGLNRAPGETQIGALGEGFEKGMALKDKLAMAGKGEQLLGAEQAAKSAQTALKNQADLYGVEQAAEQKEYDRGKKGTVSYGGNVYETDAQGNPIRKLGATESELNREATRAKAATDAQELFADKLAEIDNAADYGAAIQTDIEQIRKNISGWTSGTMGFMNQYNPMSDAYDQRVLVEGLKSKLGIDKLRELRAAAKSGASGMGNLTEKELDRLESAIAKIDMGGSAGAQKTALDEIEKYYQPALDAYANVYGKDKLTGKNVLEYDPATGEFK